jgi:hypothetical protein
MCDVTLISLGCHRDVKVSRVVEWGNILEKLHKTVTPYVVMVCVVLEEAVCAGFSIGTILAFSPVVQHGTTRTTGTMPC